MTRRPLTRADLLARNPVFRAVGRKPMAASKQDNLILACTNALDAVKAGTGTADDRDTLVCMVNVSMVIADKHCETENLNQILQAQDALLRADARAAQGLNWNFDGEGREAMRVAIILHQHMVEQFGQAYIVDAVLTQREMRQAGHVHRPATPTPVTTTGATHHAA